MSSGIPPAIPPELAPTKPPDPLDAMVDYVLALREEVIAAKFIFGFTASEWARISALIGPLPESVLVVLHDSTPDPDAKPLTDHGLSAGERGTTRVRVPNANQRGLSLADAQALAIKQNARLLVEAGRYTLVRDEDAARVSRESLQEVIALLRAPIPEPHEPPPRVRRTCPKRGLSCAQDLSEARIKQAIVDGELRTDCVYEHCGRMWLPIDDQPEAFHRWQRMRV